MTDVEWVEYKPKHELLVLDKKVFPEGVKIPKAFIGSNVLHLPTMKTHGHTQITGLMKNAFGGLLKEVMHHYHRYIHDVLVDWGLAAAMLRKLILKMKMFQILTFTSQQRKIP